MGTAKQFGPAANANVFLQRPTRSHFLAPDNGPDLISIHRAVIFEGKKSHAYPCTFHIMEAGPFTLAIRDVYSAGVYG